MSTKSKIRKFFGASRIYAVLGASRNQSKFGYKVLSWYVSHHLPVIPINPRENEILGQPVITSVHEVLNALSKKKDVAPYSLSDADGLSISFLTPPAITLRTLEEISMFPGYKSLIRSLWFQPGSYDRSVLEGVEKYDLYDRVIHQDECILVRGEEGLNAANL